MNNKIHYPILYLFVWHPHSMCFKSAEARRLLNDFMEDDDIYFMAVEDVGAIIDLDLICTNEKFATDVYNKFRPELKNALQHFLESGN